MNTGKFTPDHGDVCVSSLTCSEDHEQHKIIHTDDKFKSVKTCEKRLILVMNLIIVKSMAICKTVTSIIVKTSSYNNLAFGQNCNELLI